MTWLCQRDDFPELVEAAAAELRIPAAIIEKDYFVTEALRPIAAAFSDEVLFKGGTSLSKGWKLIDRFSEDIDLYVAPGPNDRQTTRRLKDIVAKVEELPIFARDLERKRSIGGFGRDEFFDYAQRTGIFPGVEATVMLEAGIQSGTEPWEERRLQSLLAEFLEKRQIRVSTVDGASFPMRLLHFRRTFVEKLFTIHDKVERQVIQDGKPLGTFARHYYDLYQLLGTQEVRTLLTCDEYSAIAADYRRLTRRHYPRQSLPPAMCLRNSAALFPPKELRSALGRDYADRCGRLCYGQFPDFTTVLSALETWRAHFVEVPEIGDVET